MTVGLRCCCTLLGAMRVENAPKFLGYMVLNWKGTIPLDSVLAPCGSGQNKDKGIARGQDDGVLDELLPDRDKNMYTQDIECQSEGEHGDVVKSDWSECGIVLC